jgi:hypothetical protein
MANEREMAAKIGAPTSYPASQAERTMPPAEYQAVAFREGALAKRNREEYREDSLAQQSRNRADR